MTQSPSVKFCADWYLQGYDCSIHMSEETNDASRTIPQVSKRIEQEQDEVSDHLLT
jgi:hypothetical protein